MKRHCAGTTKKGERCQAPPLTSSAYCFVHDPDREEERAAARSRGGFALHYGAGGKPQGEPVQVRTADDVCKLLETAASDALARKPSANRSRLLAYIATAALRAVEAHDLEGRVQALEARLTPRSMA